MPRPPAWPPPIVTRRGKQFIRLGSSGSRREICLGLANSPEARAEYGRIVAEVTGNGGKPPPGRTPDVTISEVVLAFLSHALRRWGKGTAHYERFVRALRPVSKLYGHTPAASFGPVAFRACRESFVAEEGRLSRSYINSLGSAIRQCFRWAHGEQLVPLAVYQGLDAVDGLRKGQTEAAEAPPVRPIDPAQVEATLPYLPPIVGDMVRLQLLTGMRPGEVCAMCPGDVQRPWKDVGGVPVWLYKLDEHKNDWRGHQRHVPIGPKAQLLLAPYFEGRAADAYCFSPREVTERWLRDNGRRSDLSKRKRRPADRYKTQAYDHCVRLACARRQKALSRSVEVLRREGLSEQLLAPALARCEAWSPNQLRHTVATQVETDMGREDARCALGHKNASVTAIYAEQVDRAAKVFAVRG